MLVAAETGGPESREFPQLVGSQLARDEIAHRSRQRVSLFCSIKCLASLKSNKQLPYFVCGSILNLGNSDVGKL